MAAAKETPFFFPGGGYSLFGILHAPAGPAAGSPFVLCHPFGEEKLWAHRVFVAFARQLASDGHPVLRMDYMGNGDSDGDFSQSSLATVCGDVRAAIAEVRRRTGAQTVSLLGLRFGALVASLVAEDATDVDRLILWAPIVDGGRFMQELLRINLTTQMATAKEITQDREAMVAAMQYGETVNVDGYEMAYPLYSEVSAIKLAVAKKQHQGPCLVAHVDKQPGRPAPELQQLANSYDRGTLVFAQEEPFWKEIARFYDRAPNLFQVTREWLRDPTVDRLARPDMKVFVTDGNNRAALAITRSLGARGHQVIVGEKRQPSLAQASKYCAAGVVYPDPVTDSDRFVEFVANAVRQRGVDVVLPVADITTFLVTENRDRFEPGCAVPFASADIVHRAANKIDIVQAAMRLGVPVPSSVVVCSADCVPSEPVQFPVVVKPRQSRVRTPSGWLSTSVSFAHDAAELRRDLQSRGAHEFPVMLQECIDGPGVGVFACYHGGRPIALFSHRRVRERPPWGGVSVLSESTPLDPLAQDYAVRLLDEIKWHGVAMVEFKRDRRDGVPKLMEINGRFWGSLQLAIDAGVDFPGLLVEGVRAADMPPPQPYRLGVRNRWFWGDVDSLLLTLIGGHGVPKGQQLGRGRALFDFLKLWEKDLYYENPKWQDLRPWLLETRRWIGRGLEGRRERASGPEAAGSQHGMALVAPSSRFARPAASGRASIDTTISDACLTSGNEAAWNALLPTSDTRSVFQTHEWNRSWWETFREQFDPCVVTVDGPGGVAGIAPLVVSRDRIVRFLGDGRSDYCDFLTGPNKQAAMSAMLGAVFSKVDWDAIELNNVPAESRTSAMVQAICGAAGYKVLVTDQFPCPTLIIEGQEDSARAILNKPSLRRPTNYFQRAGRLTCRNLTGAAEIEPYLDAFFEQHVARWNGTHSPSLFLNEGNRAFYRTLTRNLSKSGALLFSIIELDEAPIAFHYGLDYDGTVMWYKPSFDIAHAAHSPGLVLMRHLIAYAVDERRRELDFTVGDEPFKRRFTNLTRKTVRLVIFRESSRYLLEATRRHVVNAVKRVSPEVRSLVQRGRLAEMKAAQ